MQCIYQLAIFLKWRLTNPTPVLRRDAAHVSADNFSEVEVDKSYFKRQLKMRLFHAEQKIITSNLKVKVFLELKFFFRGECFFFFVRGEIFFRGESFF